MGEQPPGQAPPLIRGMHGQRVDQQQVRPVRVRSPAGNLGIIRVGVVIQHHASYGAGTVPGEVQRPGRLGAPGVGAGGVNALPPAGPVCTGLQSAADIVVKLLCGIQILLSRASDIDLHKKASRCGAVLLERRAFSV